MLLVLLCTFLSGNSATFLGSIMTLAVLCFFGSDNIEKNSNNFIQNLLLIICKRTKAFLSREGDNFVDVFRSIEPNTYSEAASSTNILPQALYLKYKYLTRFYLFKWKAQHDGLDSVQPLHEIVIPDRMVQIQRNFITETQRVKDSCFIFDNMIFMYLINDIKYFSSVNLISDNDVHELKEELYRLLDYTERLAARGKFDNGHRINFYISNINFDTTYSYILTQKCKLSLIKAFTLNSVASLDDKTFDSVKNWISSLKRFSTLISESGDLQRIHFFRKQRELVSTL